MRHVRSTGPRTEKCSSGVTPSVRMRNARAPADMAADVSRRTIVRLPRFRRIACISLSRSPVSSSGVRSRSRVTRNAAHSSTVQPGKNPAAFAPTSSSSGRSRISPGASSGSNRRNRPERVGTCMNAVRTSSCPPPKRSSPAGHCTRMRSSSARPGTSGGSSAPGSTATGVRTERYSRSKSADAFAAQSSGSSSQRTMRMPCAASAGFRSRSQLAYCRAVRPRTRRISFFLSSNGEK